MQIVLFLPHYQLVYINFDFSSFSLISYIAKVWFLFFECCVVAICLECYHNPFVAKWQSVRNVLAIRSQCFGKPSAMFWQSVSNILAIRQQCFGNLSATFWQSVSSRRGPIYRARIYIFTTHFVCVWLILKACYGSFAL